MFERLQGMILYLFLMLIIIGINLVCLFYSTFLLNDLLHELSRGKQVIVIVTLAILYTYLAVRLSMKINKDFSLTEILIILCNSILLAGLINSFFK